MRLIIIPVSTTNLQQSALLGQTFQPNLNREIWMM